MHSSLVVINAQVLVQSSYSYSDLERLGITGSTRCRSAVGKVQRQIKKAQTTSSSTLFLGRVKRPSCRDSGVDSARTVRSAGAHAV